MKKRARRARCGRAPLHPCHPERSAWFWRGVEGPLFHVTRSRCTCHGSTRSEMSCLTNESSGASLLRLHPRQHQWNSLYIGITSDLVARIRQHQKHTFGGFTEKYEVTRLLYWERYNDVGLAIRREKQIKGWRREKKIALIEKLNPQWKDLSRDWDRMTVRLIPRSATGGE